MTTQNSRTPIYWTSIMLALSLLLILTACGGGDPTATAEPPNPPATEAPAQGTPNVEDHIKAAATHYENGDYAKAITELEKVIELEPNNTDAYTNLALSYFKNGDYEKATTAWTKVIESTPDEAAPYYERGMCYFNLKEYESALDDFTKTIDLDATHADAYRVRGKSHAFMEDYTPAIDDFTKAIELDPQADEAYFNRAASLTKIGSTKEDLESIIYDYGMVIQINGNEELVAQAKQALEKLLESTTDNDLLQQTRNALEGKVGVSDTPAHDAEASLMDIDINRQPGHSIGFEATLEASSTHRFLFLGSPGDTVGAGITSDAAMRIGIQNANNGQILGVVPNNDDSLLVNIPQNALYHIVIEDASGEGGQYVAAFEASPKVSFALNPNYFIIGRLPENGLLYYTYTAPGGATLEGNVIPHPDTPIDIIVNILELESQSVQFTVNNAGAGENETFSFTIPDNGDGKVLTYIVSIEDANKATGAYSLAITSDLPTAKEPTDSTSTTPEQVMQIIFDAASSGDFDALQNLCDPQGQNDGDTQQICDMAQADANREEFITYFAKGQVNGEATISPQGDRAEVPFLFGPSGTSEETMILVNRDGQWYLLSF